MSTEKPLHSVLSTRRHFMSQSAAAATSASFMAFPLVAGAQPKTVKVGVLHPVTGALAYSGQQCREGALMAIEDINKAGGIKSLSGRCAGSGRTDWLSGCFL